MKAIFTLVLLVGITQVIGQTTVTLSAGRDNTIYSSYTGNSNGVGEYFFVGRNAGSNANSIQRALLYFDLSSIPAGATITSATLSLYVNRSGPVGTGIAVHKALNTWGEGTSDATGLEVSGAPATPNDATWNLRLAPSTPWNDPGGDLSATQSAAVSISGSITQATLVTLTGLAADIQGWVSNSSSNFGWFIRSANENASASVKRFISMQSAITAQRPSLSVTYTSGSVPVTLKVFNATVQHESVLLTWSTATEVNNKLFEVQHSRDGQQFKSVGSVAGAGNSTVERNYAFTHRNAVAGKHFYRLAQTDYDGSTRYSGVREVQIGNKARLAISPNPVVSQLHINYSAPLTKAQYKIANSKGELVRKGTWTMQPIDVSTLQKGTYVLTLNIAEGENTSMVFIKQ